MFDKSNICIKNSNVSNSCITNIEHADAVYTNSSIDAIFVNELLEEKLDAIKEHILKSEFNQARNDLSRIFNNQLSFFESSLLDRLYFYRFLLSKTEDESLARNSKQHIVGELKIEADIFEEILETSLGDISQLCDVAKIVLVSILLSQRKNLEITQFFSCVNKTGNQLFDDAWSLYIGIANFNLKNYDKARDLFDTISDERRNVRWQFYRALVDFEIEYNRCSVKDNVDAINIPFKKIDNLLINNPDIEEENEELIVFLKVRYYSQAKSDLLVSYVNSLDINLKMEPLVQCVLGDYYFSEGKYDEAEQAYRNIISKDFTMAAWKIVYLFLNTAKYKEILDFYAQIEKYQLDDYFFESARCYVLRKIQDRRFGKELDFLHKKYKDDIVAFYFVLRAADRSGDYFVNSLLPTLTSIINDVLESNDDRVKFAYATILINSLGCKFCYRILKSINDFSFFKKDEKLYLISCIRESRYIKYEDKICIADYLISKGIEEAELRKVKVSAFEEGNQYLSAISEMQILYSQSKDSDIAIGILCLVLNYIPDRVNEFLDYVHIVECIEKPICCLLVSDAYYLLGDIDKADRYYYYSGLLLNGDIDYNIFNGMVKVSFNHVYSHHKAKVEYKEVLPDTAVLLRNSEDKIWLCIESDIKYIRIDSPNGYAAIHISSSDCHYYDLLHSRLNESIIFCGKKYTIISIIGLVVFAFRYALEMVSQNPNKDEIPFREIKFKDSEDFLDQFKHFLKNNTSNELLKCYYSVDKYIGIPIETIINGDYSNYLNLIDSLLYDKKQNLLSGRSYFAPNSYPKKYILTVSSLVVLQKLNMVDLLNLLSDNVIVPASLISLLDSMMIKAQKDAKTSPGRLCLIEGKVRMIKTDKNEYRKWHTLLKICTKLNIMPVEDEEYISYRYCECYAAEKFSVDFKVDRCQTDSIILAQKLDASLITEDLFFRRLGSMLNIKIVNIAWMIQLLDKFDHNKALNYLEILRNTQYVVCPDIKINIDDVNRNFLFREKRRITKNKL